MQTMTHGGGSIVLWGWLAGNRTGALQKIESTMRQGGYLEILKTSAIKLKLGRNWVFQQNIDPKHPPKKICCKKVVRKFLTGKSVLAIILE